MEQLKPCKCGNEYPTLRIVDCASGSKLYQVYCKDCKKSASVSTSREEAETYWNKDMARNDLKPCPFCNNKPQLRRYGLYVYAVECNSDKCNINPRTPVCDTEEGAVELWNGRGKLTMEKKIYKSKCRYCGGDLEMYTHEDRNIIGLKS